MGWITPLGHEVEPVWRALLDGQTGFGRVTHFDSSTFATNFAAQVKNFRLDRFLSETGPYEHASPHAHYALAAAAQAWKQAGMGAQLQSGRTKARRIGMYLGAGEGALDFEPFAAMNLAGHVAGQARVDAAKWASAGAAVLDPLREIEQEPDAVLSHMAEAFGCRGPAFNCMTACAASTQAIGEAFEILKRGDADVMLSGGAHSMIHPLGMTGFIRLTAMSSRRDEPQSAARPFDQTRDGFVMGEGAGMLVLETLDHAKARGARPLCEVVGYGSSADAFRITDIQPDGRGAQGCMNQALRQAGIAPRETDAKGRPLVHYISAHGTGTQENDKIETAAVKGVFGPLAPQVPFSSVKSMLGHLIQAAGAVELITCVQAIRTGFLPPTMNLRHADPLCDLDYVPNRARDENPRGGVEVCLSNSFGFGGQNNTLCVRKWWE